MIRYLTTFQTEAAYNTFLASNDCPYINVSHIVAIDENRYYKESSVLQNTPFTITLLSKEEWADNPHVTFYVNKTNGDTIPTYCKYKINNGPWKTYNYNLTPDNEYIDLPDSTLQVGDSIQIINKSNICNRFFVYQDNGYTFKISGNIMSTVWGDDYVYAPANKVPYPGTTHSDYRHNGYEILHFSSIIAGNILTDAGDLWLPTKNLGIYIFDSMFDGCSSLTDAPDINAKYLPKEEYDVMISACDVGLIFLDYRFTIPNFPSRLLGYMQAKLPIFAVTDTASDIGKVITENNFGFWCPSNNCELFNEKVREIIESELELKGNNAWNYLIENYTAKHSYEIIVNKIKK